MKKKRKLKIIKESKLLITKSSSHDYDTCAICLNPVKERKEFAVRFFVRIFCVFFNDTM